METKIVFFSIRNKGNATNPSGLMNLVNHSVNVQVVILQRIYTQLQGISPVLVLHEQPEIVLAVGLTFLEPEIIGCYAYCYSGQDYGDV